MTSPTLMSCTRRRWPSCFARVSPTTSILGSCSGACEGEDSAARRHHCRACVRCRYQSRLSRARHSHRQDDIRRPKRTCAGSRDARKRALVAGISDLDPILRKIDHHTFGIQTVDAKNAVDPARQRIGDGKPLAFEREVAAASLSTSAVGTAAIR